MVDDVDLNGNVNLVATVGSRLDPSQFEPQPDNIHLARYISQSLLLPRCDRNGDGKISRKDLP